MKKRTGKQPLKRALIYYHSFLEYVNGSIANRFKEKREKHIDRKWHVINKVLDNIAKESGLYDKYLNADVSDLKPIGNRVWMFWYTGFDTAPPIVKKCADLASRLEEVDLVLIDKNNLEAYFTFEGNIKDLFYKGKITIQTFSDILRCQLLSRYGGFWFDATLFVTNKDFVTNFSKLSFFTIRHLDCNFFTKGYWSGYGIGAGMGHPVFSFIYDMFLAYYEVYAKVLDYFQIDYIWMYAYAHFDWVKMVIDSNIPTVSNAYILAEIMEQRFNLQKWEYIIQENLFQKLQWRKKIKQEEETYYDYFMTL